MSPRRGLARAGAVVLVGLTLVAGRFILDAQPEFGSTLAPYPLSARPGERVNVSDVVVSVLGVRGAAKVERPDGVVIDTGGVWILVRIRLEATRKATTVGYVALSDADGKIFLLTGRIKQVLGEGRTFQPGIPVEAELAFEVPPDVATSLTFQLTPGSGYIQTLLPIADIPLPITAEAVTQWRNDPTPATLYALTVTR